VFRQGISTLCNTTIEDTLATVKNCEATRYVVHVLNVCLLKETENLSLPLYWFGSVLHVIFSALALFFR